MYLICFGTRPELIKLISLIHKFKENNIQFKTLFSGQHENLIKDFYKYIDDPDFTFTNIMERGQTLNQLSSKILLQSNQLFIDNTFSRVIVQGDTTTAYSLALSAFHFQIPVIHLEAGLRTNDKYSPFPEEINRRLISQIASIHLCPTKMSIENLQKEQITNGVHLVGNTVVDIYKYIFKNTVPSNKIRDIIDNYKDYIVVTLHRRENRGDKMFSMWNQLNELSSKYKFVYITHPSLPDSKNILNNTNIILLDPQDYENMVHLISNSKGIITDSGGLQEEAVCANKRVLVCRDTTERPETIDCGLGKLIDTQITENICFFDQEIIDVVDNPYGNNVCEKIVSYI
jgi:UDP-N-acetylglucosamine 2-epimerase (non-hydrolysing)|tara:strand:- start:2273 stop:3304 length:1032 start_codon:yes stop_codon:yes gene_type:complete